MHLSIIRQHYKQGFQSVVRLIENFEMQIESLTLAQSSDLHTVCLESTIESQKNEIRRLSLIIQSKSQQLLDAQRINHQLQSEYLKETDNLNHRWQLKLDKFQSKLAETEQTNQQLQTKIRKLETCLESDAAISLKLDSHNSSLPPSLDPPWSKPKRTRSLRTRSGLKVGGQTGHKGHTLLQVADPDTVIVHRVDVCRHCHNSLIPIESRRFQKRQIFEIENGRLASTEHRIEIKHCPMCHHVTIRSVSVRSQSSGAIRHECFLQDRLP